MATKRTLTEAEYKALWCPNATVVEVTAGSGNRDSAGNQLSGTQCIGSACAHWVWVDQQSGKGTCGQ